MSFGKPSWKLVEVEDQAEADPDVEDDQGEHEQGYRQVSDPDVDADQDGQDFRAVIRQHTFIFI